MIILNEQLITSLFAPKDQKNKGDLYEKKEIILRFKDKLRPFHYITLSGIQELRKGVVKDVQIKEEKKGKRWITRILDLDNFDFDLSQIAKIFSIKFCSTASIKKYTVTGGKQKEYIHIQGKVGQQAKDLLTEKLNIPQKYINIDNTT